MSCIVGLIREETVYMGGDSAGVSGLDLVIRRDPKVFLIGGNGRPKVLIGYTSSFRMGQILRFGVSVPDDQSADAFEYMVKEFVPEIRKAFKDSGFAKIDSNVESGGVFLVGYKGRLFEIESDFQVGERIDDFNAVGCGRPYAIGSLYESLRAWAFEKAGPEAIVNRALKTAARFSAGVREPFVIEKIKNGS